MQAHLDAIERQGARTWVDASAARLPRDLAGLVRHRGRVDTLRWHRADAIHTVADLRAHAEAGAIAGEVIGAVRGHQPRINLGRALAALELLLEHIAASDPSLEIIPAGSLRRYEPTVGDLTVLLVGEPSAAVDVVLRLVDTADVRARSSRGVTVDVDRQEVTFRAITPPEAGCALLHYTGSHEHLELLRRRADGRGLRLGPRTLTDLASGAVVPTASEESVYAALGLPWIPPERRLGEDEIALAEQGRLGVPLTVSDIRGDLHLHTLWSDGRDSTEGIVWAARALGYAYLAITDHSPTAAASRTLSIERLAQQAAEIAALRDRHPEITILHGTEVDILEDGRLDFPDRILEDLDIVLASLHDSHGQDGPALTRRYVRAMEHPLVNVITHPANRVPGRSEGYDLDWDLFFRTAARTGTAVEIDGAPGHIDLDGRRARHAVTLGAMLVVDSDGHFAERIGRQMRIGVGTAARGGVEARHVLNTRPVEEIRAFVAAKRGRPGGPTGPRGPFDR